MFILYFGLIQIHILGEPLILGGTATSAQRKCLSQMVHAEARKKLIET